MAKPTRAILSIRTKCKRMVEVRLMRKKKIKENRKPSEIKADIFDTEADKFINTLLRRRLINNPCRHYLIGASHAYALARGNYSLKHAHSFFYTAAENKVIGQAGEEAFIKSHSNIVIKHPFGIHKTMPWFCATGDYLIKESGISIIAEVKTFADFERANYFYNNVDRRTIMQLWLQFEVFNVERGRIVVYYLDRIAKVVFLLGTIHVVKQASIFTSEFILLSVVRYIGFLKEYFDKIKIYPSDNYFQKLNVRLTNNSLTAIPAKKKNDDNLFVRTVKRVLKVTCPYLEENSMNSGLPQKIEFVPYKEMFKHHKFVHKSRIKRFLSFDEEYRRDFLNEIFSHLDQETQKILNDLRININSSFVIKNFISFSKLKRTRSLSEAKKSKQERSSNQKTGIYQLIIEKQKAKIKALQKENQRLKHVIADKNTTTKLFDIGGMQKTNINGTKAELSATTKQWTKNKFDIQCKMSVKTIKKTRKK